MHLDLATVLAKKEEPFSEMLLRMIDEDYVPSKKTAISFVNISDRFLFWTEVVQWEVWKAIRLVVSMGCS